MSAQTAPVPQERETPEGVIRELYDHVTFDAGAPPDWDVVRELFLPQATIILRTSREGSTIFDMDGFIQDWLNFFERDNVLERGFSEAIVRMHTTEFGDLAHIFVLYEASFPDWDRPPQRGVDSVQLTKKDGRWWIVSITNEIPTPNRPIPEVLRGG